MDENQQIMVAADVTSAANDKQQATPLGQQTEENRHAAGIQPPTPEDGSEPLIPLSADTGYFSEANVRNLESLGFDPYLATGRQKYNQPAFCNTVGDNPPSDDAKPKERMAFKLETASGRARYAKRLHIVEPVFVQMKQGRGFWQFLLRGLKKVRGEWKRVCLTHNLLKIWRYRTALT